MEPSASDTPFKPFVLSGIRVDPGRNLIVRPDASIRVEPRVMELLQFLGDHVDLTCSREDIMASVWTDSLPNEEALTQSVSKLRKALGDDNRTLLETVRKVGYRLNGPLLYVSPEPSQNPGGSDRAASHASGLRPVFTRRLIVSLAAMLLVALGISRVKVIAIHHDGPVVDGPRMVHIKMDENGSVLNHQGIMTTSDSTVVFKWIKKSDKAERSASDG